jgi:hypothetical protein
MTSVAVAALALGLGASLATAQNPPHQFAGVIAGPGPDGPVKFDGKPDTTKPNNAST